MSSTPFNLGIPVMDDVPPRSGSYVLRSKDENGLSRKIQELQHLLSKNDLIRIYYIGYRPDWPIPVSRYFAEIYVGIGEAEEWQQSYSQPWDYTLYHRIATGMN